MLLSDRGVTNPLAARLAWLIGGAVLAWYVVTASIGRTTHGFIAYYAAAQLLATGELTAAVYDDAWFVTHVQALTGAPVIEIFGPNAPTMAILALPVAWLSPGSARTVWLLASIGSYAAALAVAIGDVSSPRLRAAIVLAALIMPAVFANVRTGQAYLFVAAAYLLIGTSMLRGREGVAGVLLGGLLIAKTTGLPLLLVFLIRRRWRAVWAAALTIGVAVLPVAVLTGPDIWWRYPIYVAEFMQRPTIGVTAYQTTIGWARHFEVTSIVPTVVLLLMLAATVGGARNAPGRRALALGILASMLLAPIAEDHQFVILVSTLPLVWDAWPTWWWLPIATLLWLPLSGLEALYPRLIGTWLLWLLTLHDSFRRAN